MPLKQLLIAFWAVWHTIVLATNVADAGKHLGLVPATWTFASGNYEFLVSTTNRHATPVWLNAVMFAGVIAWEAVAAILFWLALRGDRAAVRRAFTASLMLWAAFMIADEIFIAYPVSATHLRLFIAQLVTLLAIDLAPTCDFPPHSRQ